MGRKLGGGCHFFGGAGSLSNTKSPEPRPTSIPSRISVHPAVSPQRTLAENWVRALPPFLERGARSASNTMLVGWRLSSLSSGMHVDPSSHFATTDMGRKLGGAVPLSGGARDRADDYTCMPCFILIHKIVWPQYTNVTDRQTGQDRQTYNGLIA